MVGARLEIEVHNGKTGRPLAKQGCQRGVEEVDARESQGRSFTAFHLARLNVLPAYQPAVVIKLQVTLRLALTHYQEWGISGQSIQIEVAQDIHIMYQDRRGRVEERQCLLDTATGLQQSAGLIADAYVESEVGVSLQIVHYLLGEMVHVDNDTLIARRTQLHHDMPQQRLPPYPDKCLGHRVCQGFQAGTKARSENHGLLHGAKLQKLFDTA